MVRISHIALTITGKRAKKMRGKKHYKFIFIL